ncbi:hypothetical protein NDI52_33685 [Leptolyngbya sp. PL-A3]|uniref:hypothetical protein n=1 Tax=Leptolyngbya sp. PL-A3 TaxID=2933911 RepID=UPI0032968C8B
MTAIAIADQVRTLKVERANSGYSLPLVKQSPEAIEVIQLVSEMTKGTSLPPIMLRGDALAMANGSESFALSLLWFLSFQGYVSKKLPIFSDWQMKAIKPIGEIFHTLFDLLKEIYNFCEEFECLDVLPYNHALGHWRVLVKEGIECDLRLESLRKPEGKRETADRLAKQIQGLNKCFESKENPYDPIATPASFELIKICLEVGAHRAKDSVPARKRRKVIRDVLFGQCMDAMRKWQVELKRGGRLNACYSNGKSLVVIESGRKTTKL